jgi:hypothetical protein
MGLYIKRINENFLFQSMMIRWCKLYGQLANIESFTYVFPCDFGEKNNEIDIYGTGGSLLEDLKRVLSNLTGLKQFELKNLELDEIDGQYKATQRKFP